MSHTKGPWSVRRVENGGGFIDQQGNAKPHRSGGSMKWTRETHIRLVDLWKNPFFREGYVSGPFSVHRSARGYWTLSHLRTGCAIKAQIGSLRQAKRLGESLAHLDWNLTSIKSRKIKVMAPVVSKIISEVLQ